MNPPPAPSAKAERPTNARVWRVEGRVQGVGFRPFVYRLAHELGLRGWVRNQAGQVQIHTEGPPSALDQFGKRLLADAPPTSRPQIVETRSVPEESATDFNILPSADTIERHFHLPPDLFTCPDCLAELADPGERRHHYPFINCTQCGPRYTIIARLPYDRPNTSMAGFPLCPDCQAELDGRLLKKLLLGEMQGNP